ncbi:MAG: AraC family transcriptional regulator [Clostridia bacterium]|nr:AraC family transcriptional regulator [Clostridia bacterium]
MNTRYGLKATNIIFSSSYDPVPPENLDISHCHDTYEILYVVSGEGRCIVEGSIFPIKPGSLMLISPFQYHKLQVKSDVPYERFVINFSDAALLDDVRSFTRGILTEDGTAGRLYSAGAIPSGIISVFERFELGGSLSASERSVFMRMLLSEILLLLAVSKGEKLRGDEEELGARVIRYLNENIEKNISLDKLARRFFVSKYYLCRAFKKHNGISVHGYINQKRVMYAKGLIEQGETASGAAYRVGFGDYSAFYRAYVKILGKSPSSD